MSSKIDDIKNVKGFIPGSIKYAQEINGDFGEALAGFYKAVWNERENELSMKENILSFSQWHVPTTTLKVLSRSLGSSRDLMQQETRSRM
ncbi:MAG: hypothetical protein U9N13_05490 [Euryarchaeota archaeon]|nr:hypothetical protein [Euryarchaeota archaeon]